MTFHDGLTLVLQHQDDDGPGNFGDWLNSTGREWELVDATEGLPEPAKFEALVVLGSRESVFDTDVPWIAAEREFVRQCIAAGTPVLGLCFGGQLLADVLGGSVRRMPEAEVGWISVKGASPYAGSWFSWHQDTVVPPSGATVLASTELAAQAFQAGPHIGIQFHPELTTTQLGDWLSSPRKKERLVAWGGDVERIIEETTVFGGSAVIAAQSLYEHFYQHAATQNELNQRIG